MEKDCRREPEGEIDRCRERERQNEEERALELEQERHDRQREEKTDEAPCAEIVGSSRRAPSTSNPAISLSNVNKDRCIVLDNVFDGTVEREDEFYLGIRNHLHRNSVRCGPVHHIHVDRKCGRVFMLFDCARSANKAAEKWHQTMGKLHTNFASRDIEEDDLSEDNEESFCNPVSKDNVRDSNFDKALIEFYMKNVSSSLKHAHSKKSRMENADSKVCTRYSGKLFSTVIKALTPKQISVIKLYGMECMLKFVKTDVPLRFVKWIASVFDTNSSEIQLTKKFIPVNKQTIHNILDLPIGGIELVPDCEAGREFLLSHFKVTSIPNVNFFANKLISGEELSDEDIFICFMSVCFTSFLCPNSSLLPSTQYFHIFKDCKSFARYDLSKFVYDWLITSIRSFKLATKKLSKRTITFGGCHYALDVSYLDSVEFGLNSLPDEYPRILVWKGNRIRQYSEMDKNSSNSFGKRPLKRLVPASVYQVERSFGKDSYKKFSKTFSSPFNLNGKLKALFSSFLTNEVIDDIVQIIHTNNIGKPKDFEAWSHSLVCDVLSCLQNSQHAPEPSCSNNSIDIPETEGISKPPMVDSFQANNGKLVPILNEGNGCVVDVNVPVQPDVATKVLSPIVPIRLSNVFNQQVSQNDFVNLVETILRYNGNNGDIVQTAFEGANSAFLLWRSDQMQFPIVIANHWFLFVVCLKAKVFAFCDSLYDEGDPFHNAFREPLVKL
ncbi:hypothetical protein ACQ4PT_059170 [Festuca glaucescens]